MIFYNLFNFLITATKQQLQDHTYSTAPQQNAAAAELCRRRVIRARFIVIFFFFFLINATTSYTMDVENEERTMGMRELGNHNNFI